MKEIAVAIVQRADQFLVGKRPAGVPLAGFDEFPGGKVEPNEEPSAAAVRECSEETGLAIEIDRLFLTTTHQYDHGELRIHFFLSHPIAGDPKPKPPFKWVDQSQLPSLKFPEANDEVMQLLIAGK